MSKRNTHGQLLSIILYCFTGKDIADLRHKNQGDIYKSLIPKYVITEDGKLNESEFYHQWVDSPNEKHFVFNISHADGLLQHEIDNCGIDDLLEDFKLLPILQKMESYSYSDFGKIIPMEQHLLIDMTYRCGGEPGAEDCDLDVELIGYYDRDFNLLKV